MSTEEDAEVDAEGAGAGVRLGVGVTVGADVGAAVGAAVAPASLMWSSPLRCRVNESFGNGTVTSIDPPGALTRAWGAILNLR